MSICSLYASLLIYIYILIYIYTTLLKKPERDIPSKLFRLGRTLLIRTWGFRFHPIFKVFLERLGHDSQLEDSIEMLCLPLGCSNPGKGINSTLPLSAIKTRCCSLVYSAVFHAVRLGIRHSLRAQGKLIENRRLQVSIVLQIQIIFQFIEQC